MDAITFCYWLNGLLTVSGKNTLDEKQVDLVRKQLSIVFAGASQAPPSPPKEEVKIDPEALRKLREAFNVFAPKNPEELKRYFHFPATAAAAIKDLYDAIAEESRS
jgi:hypothetical protein